MRRAEHRSDGGSKAGKKRARGSWFATHGRDLKFLLIFVAVMGLYYGVTTTEGVKYRFFPWYLEWNAGASGAILNGIGYDDVTVEGKAIGSPQFGVQIERGCDAVSPSALFVAAVLASPIAFRRKIPAAIIGVLLLLVLNLVRIVSLFLTGLYFPRFFETMHLDVWQALFIIFALCLWAIWASWESRTRRSKPNATA